MVGAEHMCRAGRPARIPQLGLICACGGLGRAVGLPVSPMHVHSITNAHYISALHDTQYFQRSARVHHGLLAVQGVKTSCTLL
jgi:hypothetical protein